MTRQLQLASLDTSFWIHCYAARLEPYLFDYFQVYASSEVVREATPPYPGIFSVMLPNVKMFHLLEEHPEVKKRVDEALTLYVKKGHSLRKLARETGLPLYLLLMEVRHRRLPSPMTVE